jgi:hypothetical protein
MIAEITQRVTACLLLLSFRLQECGRRLACDGRPSHLAGFVEMFQITEAKRVDASLSMLVGAFGFGYAFFQNVVITTCGWGNISYVKPTGLAGVSTELLRSGQKLRASDRTECHTLAMICDY